MNINTKCIVIFILQFLLQNISSQNVYEVSGSENKTKEYISDIYFTGNKVFVLFNKTWKNKQVKGFKVNYNLHGFFINQNRNLLEINKPILKFKRAFGGYNEFIINGNQITIFGNYAETSNVMKCDLSGNILDEMVFNKTNCGVQDFIGFTKSSYSVFKDWCAQEIYL